MVHGILPREELSRLMSELGSGGRGEALVRALILHQRGPGSGLGISAIHGLELVNFANAPMNALNNENPPLSRKEARAWSSLSFALHFSRGW